MILSPDRFVGGRGEACSHMAEGLSTALQLFDDLDELREPKYVFCPFVALMSYLWLCYSWSTRTSDYQSQSVSVMFIITDLSLYMGAR